MRNERDILMTDAEIARSFCSWPWVLNFMQMRNVHGFLNISQFFSELKYTFLGVKNSKVAKPHNVSNDADSITDFERLWCGRCVNAKHLLMASKKEKKKRKRKGEIFMPSPEVDPGTLFTVQRRTSHCSIHYY